MVHVKFLLKVHNKKQLIACVDNELLHMNTYLTLYVRNMYRVKTYIKTMDDNKRTSSTKRAKSRSHYRDIADKKTAYS